ncbi:MAG: filamentous hemagglutinin N-terminal domain-containing protein, partial [Gammaproteobacteria bacterium]
MSAKTLKPVRAVAAALLALAAGKASAAPPPLPSFDGVNPIVSGILPFVGNSGGRGVVRTSGSSTGSTVFANVNGTTVDIQTNARRMVIDWQSFNIGEGHRVNFLLPDRASIAVNRVRGVGSEFVSSINGDLWSNGNVWLLNPNGVFFGATARVDVAGLLATPAYLRNLDDLIRPDGSFAPSTEVRFNMPGASFSTEVTTPGAIGIAQGAEILVRGGPAMFIVGSGVQGRTLTVGGTVTSRSSDLLRGVLTPPSSSSSNGSYGSLPTASDPAEEISSQVVYAASGDFALALAERSIAEPSPPNPLSSNDLDLFDLIIERGFAGRQGSQDQMASDVIFVDSTAKTVAGQVVVRAAAEGSVLNRRYDLRVDLGDNLGCDPTQPTCTITANPGFDTYVYRPQSGDYELLCTKGPATDACGPPLSGDQTSSGFRFSAYLGKESTSRPDYGCGSDDPDCSPGILIRSSLTALDPRGQSPGYGFGMDRSLIVDAAPTGYRGNVTLSRDTAGRPIEVMVGTAPNPGRVLVDPSYASTRDFDFGPDGGVKPLALEFVSAGDIDIRGRDVCVTVGPCFEPGRVYAPNDIFNTDRVHLRLQAGPRRSSVISARRLMFLGETYLSGATLSLEGDEHTAPEGGGQTPSPPRQMVIRNGFVDPRAGTIKVGDGSGEARIVVGSFGVDPGNDITLGSIYGTANTYIFADSRNTLRIADFDGNTATPGVVKGYYVSLAGADGLSVGDLAASGAVDGIAIGLYSKSGSITA